MKVLLKSIIRHTPYRVIRARYVNRFQAIEECLIQLAGRGYEPRVIIDGGANLGEFAKCAARIFPSATIHLIEPQPACRSMLANIASGRRFRLHPVALGSEDGHIDFGVDPAGATTGAHMLPQREAPTDLIKIQVPVTRIDSLLKCEIFKEDRTLFKLDLQGWELEALRGAEGIFDRIEVILTEVSFFAQSYEPPIETLVRFLDDRAFSLQDVAALAARRRDNRARQGDFLFVRRDSALMADRAWA